MLSFHPGEFVRLEDSLDLRPARTAIGARFRAPADSFEIVAALLVMAAEMVFTPTEKQAQTMAPGSGISLPGRPASTEDAASFGETSKSAAH